MAGHCPERQSSPRSQAGAHTDSQANAGPIWAMIFDLRQGRAAGKRSQVARRIFLFSVAWAGRPVSPQHINRICMPATWVAAP